MSNNNRGNQNGLTGLCTPAKLYGIVSLVGVGGLLASQQFIGALGQALFAAIWVFVLNWICREGWTGLSWFLVLLPIIIMIVIIIAGVAIAAVDPDIVSESRGRRRE